MLTYFLLCGSRDDIESLQLPSFILSDKMFTWYLMLFRVNANFHAIALSEDFIIVMDTAVLGTLKIFV